MRNRKVERIFVGGRDVSDLAAGPIMYLKLRTELSRYWHEALSAEGKAQVEAFDRKHPEKMLCDLSEWDLAERAGIGR